MAAEFVACYEASNHGIWLRNFVTGLKIVESIERPLKLYCDNKSTILYSNNNRSSTKSKHIDIKFLVVKERVQSGQISIEHLGTNSMIADPLTKGLPLKVFSWACCLHECFTIWGIWGLVGDRHFHMFCVLCLISCMHTLNFQTYLIIYKYVVLIISLCTLRLLYQSH